MSKQFLDLLVAKLPDFGGWPEGAVQCHRFVDEANIDFYDEGGNWPSDCPLVYGGIAELLVRKKKVPCESEAVTRAEYLAAGGWMAHGGNGCPPDLEKGTMLDLKDRDGSLLEGVALFDECESYETYWSWKSTSGSCNDIVAYRVIPAIKPEVAEPVKADNDGWIEWGGGECPVFSSVLVDVKFKYGSTYLGELAGPMNWLHYGTAEDIIAYRPHRASHPKPVGGPDITPAKPAPADDDLVLYWKTRAETAERDLSLATRANEELEISISVWVAQEAEATKGLVAANNMLRRTKSKLKARNIKINQLERLLSSIESEHYGSEQILGNHAKIIQAHDVALEKMVDNVNLALALAESPELNPDHVVTLRRLIAQDHRQLSDKIFDMMKNRYDVDLPF